MDSKRKEDINKMIERALAKASFNDTPIAESYDELIEELKIYQYELEFQNDELKRIQVDLQKSHDEFQDLFQEAPVGYLILDEDFEIIECNRTLQKIVGITSDCEAKRDFRKLLAFESQDTFYHFWKDLLQMKDPLPVEVKMTNEFGAILIAFIYGRLVHDQDRKEIRLAIVDNTSIYRARKELELSESKYNGLVSRMSQGLALHRIILDDFDQPIDYEFLEINDAFEVITGLKKKEVIGKTAREIFKDFDPSWVARYGRVALTGQPTSFEDFSTHLQKYFEIFAYQNAPGQFAVIFGDITQRKALENEVYKRQQLLDIALTASSTVVWELNLSTFELTAIGSEALVEISGQQPHLFKNLPKDKWMQLIYHQDRDDLLKQIMRFEANTNSLAVVRCRIQKPDGSLTWVAIKGKVIGNDAFNKPLILSGIIENIQETVEIELEISRKNEELIKMVAEKDRFFSIIAHDLRSPFNSFLGFTELLTDDFETLPKSEILKILQMMRKSANNVYALLENLLEWSMLQQNRVVAQKKEFNLNQLIHATIDLLQPSAQNKQITLCFNKLDNYQAYADTNMVHTVLRNLITNGIKFSTIGCEVKVDLKQVDVNMLEVSVLDTGIGMDEELLANLFSLNGTSGRKGTAGEPSTGLGLLLCQELVRLCGGELKVESSIGQGSKVLFTLPIRPV
jgi:PAS domain S-box-containing protein